MKWSWRIGRIAGIAIRVHVTFPLFLLWIGLRDGQGATAAAFAVGAMLALFTIVLLHELGHALMARRFGIATRDITLLPIGGLARLERMPREPRQELLIAIAGPAVNLVLALLFGAILIATGGPRSLVEFDLLRRLGAPAVGHVILAELVAVNVGLILFNLLPAFPMDGGRVLRALLALWSKDHLVATRRATLVGRLFAAAFVAYGLFASAPNLVLIGLFVWLAGAGEASAVATEVALERTRVPQFMMTDFRTVDPADPLGTVADLVIAGAQQDFPVLADGVYVGMLGRADLVRGLRETGADATVATVMATRGPVVTVDDHPDAALAALHAAAGRAVPVLRDGTVVGLLTTENLAEYVLLRRSIA